MVKPEIIFDNTAKLNFIKYTNFRNKVDASLMAKSSSQRGLKLGKYYTFRLKALKS